MLKHTLSVVLALTLFIGCGSGRQTAVVTERAEQPARTAGEATAQPDTIAAMAEQLVDAVEVGRFDTGKMWTFDNPPLDYFEETYGFRPDSQWFEQARLGTLRLPNCTASFVSPSGLILTNHHCARTSVTAVEESGENLLDDGFYAASLTSERRVEDLYVDQVIEIRDVTADVYETGQAGADEAELRSRRAEQIERRLDGEAKSRDTTLTVEVIELYNGGQYSAYTFRRYEDVRLVMAPQLSIGAFGGDPDNFTYPRFSLDFSFLRAYNADGEPLESPTYFRWSTEGSREGDAVFVVGNPGTTSRLSTVAQLEFERDYTLPQALDVLRTRMDILARYIEQHPEEAQEYDLRNAHHQLSNQVKKNEGELAGLRDPALIARRQAAENQLQQDIAPVDTLSERYGDAIQSIRQLQSAKQGTAAESGAFTFFASPAIDSHVLIRAVYGYILNTMQQRGTPSEQIQNLREDALEISDWPAELEKEMLAARLRELRDYLGTTDPTVNRVLQGRTPEAVADQIVDNTALTDSASYVGLLDDGYLGSGDPTVSLAQALTPLYFSIQQQVSGLQNREQALNAGVARARFALYGTHFPPDASFSLRIADGVVASYSYNGTRAPAYTTYFGMYDHFYSYSGVSDEWDLPESWQTPPAEFDLSTPVNLVSTNDITGGNSGSPLLNRDLEVVGLIFDSNIDALQNTYIYLDERGRAVSVDSRGILEALDDMYGADRLVEELTTGRLPEVVPQETGE